MRCEPCCLEDPAYDNTQELDALLRKLASCEGCPLLADEAPIPASVLRRQLERLKGAGRQLRQRQNRIRQLEHEQKELTLEIQRSDERVAKLEQTQKATAQVADEQLRAQVALLGQQQEAILALSTPIIQVWDGVLVLPLIGQLDDGRMQALTENLLRSLQEQRARHAILDLTGISQLDATSGQHLLRVAAAVRLLGAEPILCGLRPQVVRTVSGLGAELGALTVTRTLQEALRRCMDTGR